MKLITFDTETQGIPIWSMPSEHPDQPRIISLAADLHDETGRTFGALNVLIKPDGWTVPANITELTGISTEMCEEYGVPMGDVLQVFIEMWKQSKMRIGHNESFDMRMIRIELMRHRYFSTTTVNGVSYADHWKAGLAYCTQGKSTKIVNAARPDSEKKKTASLADAYEHFTGKPIQDAHSAWADTQACKTVYFALQQLNGATA